MDHFTTHIAVLTRREADLRQQQEGAAKAVVRAAAAISENTYAVVFRGTRYERSGLPALERGLRDEMARITEELHHVREELCGWTADYRRALVAMAMVPSAPAAPAAPAAPSAPPLEEAPRTPPPAYDEQQQQPSEVKWSSGAFVQ